MHQKEITIVIPCYNEKPEVLEKTVNKIHSSLKDYVHEIIVVDDASHYKYDNIVNCILIHHKYNKGYGASIKTGILNSKYSLIGITDADGTYPSEYFVEMLTRIENNAMIVGARQWKDINLIRRLPKFLLTKYASYLSKVPIKDLNSGMRIFRKDIAFEFWRLFPNRFSFTSTITMCCITNGYEVDYIDIPYYKRIGKSKISPINDTIRFFSIVTKLSLYFNPYRFFFPLSLLFLALAIGRGIRDYILNGYLGGLALVLFFMSFQIFFFGLIAQIISRTRNIKY
ncbi:MAG: glycosyltransferase family 2 protein [Bacteroidales bacterium]|nr:glycosyltransferase family 2 protein [Bacteroidales bacterium]